MQEGKTIEEYVALDEKESGLKEKLTGFLNSKYFVVIAIILVATIAFSLGRISGLEGKREPVKIISESSNINNPLNPPYIKGETGGVTSSKIQQTATVGVNASQSKVTTVVSPINPGGQVVASKNGGKYHYPWCSGAKQISPQNLITFNSIEEARAAGYTPAANCKGLK